MLPPHRGFTVWEIMKKVDNAWNAYPEENLRLLFGAKVGMMHKIIAVKGDNTY